LELLRYVPYLKHEKANIRRFVSGLPLEFRDWIDYDEPRLPEEVTGKLKHCYDQSKQKTKSQQGWKVKEKAKVKWKLKRTRPQDVSEKKMLHLTIILMGHNTEGSGIKVMVQDGRSVGHVVRGILRGFVHGIRVVCLIFLMHRKHEQLEMLGRAFHGFMQRWITSRQITRQLLSRWTVSFVIKLFPF